MMIPVVLAVSSWTAQDNPPTAREIDAIQASLLGDLRGFAENNFPPAPAPPVENPRGGAVSASQLRHKVPKQAQQAFSRGVRLSAAGHHEEAAREFEKAVARDPDYAIARAILGTEYARMQQYTEAEAQLHRSITLDPGSWPVHYNLAVLFSNEGNFEEAEQSVRRALELAPANPDVNLLLGMLLWQRGESRAETVRCLQFAAHDRPEAALLLKQLELKGQNVR